MRLAFPKPGSRAEIMLCAGVIAVLLCAVYANSFSGPFIFDDTSSITRNPTIRSWTTAFSPPPNSGITVSGRPLLNASLAVNFALSGTQVWSYHVVNLLLHLGSTLLLFGVVRRTFLQPGLRDRFGREATGLAVAVALLWGLHPLQTESVTYIVQRAESLAGLCYLLTLYAFIRFTTEERVRTWRTISVAGCFLGMTSKEIMVSAPLMVLLYDWLFVSGNWREIWQRRRRYYLMLASSWLLLGWLIWQTGNRGGTAGLVESIPRGFYVLTQCEAVVRYISLSLVPAPLTLDYGIYVVKSPGAVWLQMLLLFLLGMATLAFLWRRSALAFPLVWFFAILAPTSSIVPVVSQTMAEHRMYLPLAGVMMLVVLGLRQILGQKSYIVFALLAMVFALLTVRRNFDYQSELGIWNMTVSTWPKNHRAWKNLGNLYLQQGRVAEAMNCFEEAQRLAPQSAEIICNIGAIMARAGMLEPAIARFQQALQWDPSYADAHLNLGLALLLRGDLDGGATHFTQAVKLEPTKAETHKALAMALRQAGRNEEAAASLAEAERVDPLHLQERRFFPEPAAK